MGGNEAGRNSPRKEVGATERSKEGGGAKEVLQVPKQSPEPAHPFPPSTAKPHPPGDPPIDKPLRETREERPERQAEESRRQWKRQKEEDEKTNKGWGDNGGGYAYYERDGNATSTYVHYETNHQKGRYIDPNRRKREYTPRR